MYVDYKSICSHRVADFLIVTATDRETQALLDTIAPISKDEILEVSHNGHNYNIGRLGLFNIIHCQCRNMGAVALGASLDTVDEAIKAWPCIKGVIMVGIAFGIRPTNQKYGTVLVSEKLYPYESQRVSSDRTEYRGKEISPNKYLLAAFRSAASNWSGYNYKNEVVQTEFGPILTGEKLVDRLTYREELATEYPDAIGGEMEGQGVATACERHGKPWILIKSICDFADGNKGEDKHQKQNSAATLAFNFCKNVLEEEDFLKDLLGGNNRCVYTYDGNTYEKRLVLFSGYNENCEPFYIKREIDNILNEVIRTHGCWLYGNSGVGKSVALSRLLIYNKIPFISIDLSTCIGATVDEMFIAIYENICEKNNVTPLQSVVSYRQCIKEIATLLENKYAGISFVIFIDEIPLDINNKEFCCFINKFVAFVIYLGKYQHSFDVKFVLSSLESPETFLQNFQMKLNAYLKIIHMLEWSDDECRLLVEMLTEKLGLKWDEDYKSVNYINEMDNSPRKIKDMINQAVATDRLYISSDVINKLSH